MKTIIRINTDSSMNELNLNIENKSIVNTLNKNSNSRGYNNIRHLYTWINNDDTIRCYGWYDGDEEHINKHELIPNGSSKFLDEDSSTILLYGDIFLLSFDDKNRIKNFDISEYSLYYTIVHENIDDCVTDDSENSEPDSSEEDPDYDDDEDDDSDDDYDDDDDDDNFEIIDVMEEELDYDNNKY